jgi:ComF family protein
MFLRETLGRTLDLLFPKRCVGCEEEGEFLCGHCEMGLMRSQPVVTVFDEGKVIACGSYHQDKLLRKLISLYKYKFSEEVADILLKLMVRVWAGMSHEFGEEVLVVPVPLHKSRQNYRGFNQSALLGRKLAGRFSSLEFCDCLERRRKGKVQAGLDKEERADNLAGAIGLRGGSALVGARVLLIDDVTTTGSTLQECRRVLKKAGAEEVWALVLARANARIQA